MGIRDQQEIIERLDRETKEMNEVQSLRFLAERFAGRIHFSTNFGYEDQVITNMICTGNIPIQLFTLDTGRHFEDTYKVMNSTITTYGKTIQVYFPESTLVEQLLSSKGAFSFYKSIENRQECCHIRKVLPLQRAIQGAGCWVTGLRSGQSKERSGISRFSWDHTHGLVKFNPIINWTFEEVTRYIREHHVPYHSLHDRGFPSIGCAPCTRAVEPGADIRSGRWWWENNRTKECGLHTDNIEIV